MDVRDLNMDNLNYIVKLGIDSIVDSIFRLLAVRYGSVCNGSKCVFSNVFTPRRSNDGS